MTDAEILHQLRIKMVEHAVAAKKSHKKSGRQNQEAVINHTALWRIYGKAIDALAAEIGS
jgi:hypothetical protein